MLRRPRPSTPTTQRGRRCGRRSTIRGASGLTSLCRAPETCFAPRVSSTTASRPAAQPAPRYSFALEGRTPECRRVQLHAESTGRKGDRGYWGGKESPWTETRPRTDIVRGGAIWYDSSRAVVQRLDRSYRRDRAKGGSHAASVIRAVGSRVRGLRGHNGVRRDISRRLDAGSAGSR